MRKVDDGEKRKEKEKNAVFSGHYVIASSQQSTTRTTTARTPHARAKI